MEPSTLYDFIQRTQPFTNISSNEDTISGISHPVKPVLQPGKLLLKDNKRIRRYINTETEETHVISVQNRQRSSNYYSYNMCHDITDKNNTNKNNSNNNDASTRSAQAAKTIAGQKRTICGWMCTNNNNENNLTPVHPGRFQASERTERRESMFSKHANNARRSQQKQKPLINNSKNQPMQHLFKFWNQMKTSKSKSFSN